MQNKKISAISDGVNTKLVYTLDAQERVMQFPHGMISNNNIKGIPGYSVRSEQNVCRLIYNIPASVNLSTLIKQNITKSTVIALFRNIIDVILNAEEYMLYINSLYLDMDYIYVDLRSLAVYMICIPTNYSCTLTLNELIRGCISQGVFDLREDGTYPSMINNYLNMNRSIIPSDFRRFLDSISGTPANTSNFRAQSAVGQINAAQPVAAGIKPAQQPNKPAVSAPAERPAAPISSEEQNITDKGHKGLFFRKNTKEKPQKPTSGTPSAAPNTGFGGMAIPGVNPIATGISMPQSTTVQPSDNKLQRTAVKAPAKPVQQAAPVQTAHPVQQMPMQSQPEAWIDDKQGMRQRISVPVFWIGRSRQSETKNNLIISNPGVGKNHAYIKLINGKYFLTDNNSQNGTFVNGKRISSNTSVELHNGDRIAFWNEEYTFGSN